MGWNFVHVPKISRENPESLIFFYFEWIWEAGQTGKPDKKFPFHTFFIEFLVQYDAAEEIDEMRYQYSDFLRLHWDEI